jgi:hypothetical protein
MRSRFSFWAFGGLAMAASLAAGVVFAGIDECCDPAAISTTPPTPLAGSTCQVTGPFQHVLAWWFFCSDSNPPNCSGDANEDAANGECNDQPESNCNDNITSAVPGAECGSFACAGFAINAPPPCGCSWYADDPQPEGCPVTIQGVPGCNGSQCN